MRDATTLRGLPWQPFLSEKLLLGLPARDYLQKQLTPFNLIAAAIVLPGLAMIAYRFWAGLAAVTNLSQTTPWGLWIGFDMLCGVALAAGGYTLAAAVYL